MREDWQEFALCLGSDLDFVDYGAKRTQPTETTRLNVMKLKRVCQKCDVVNDCLDFALKTKQFLGIWGGSTPRERRLLLQQSQKGDTVRGRVDIQLAGSLGGQK